MIVAFLVLYFAFVEVDPVVSLLEKFKGCMLAGAVGDALGIPVEGARGASAGRRRPVNGLAEGHSGIGRISGDTQMTAVLAQAIIEIGRFDRSHVAFKFGRWIDYSDRGLNEARDVEEACVTAARSLNEGAGVDTSAVDSAGCGAAVRAGPIGLRYFDRPEALTRAAVEQARITHRDARAAAGSVAIALAVAAGIRDEGELDAERVVSEIGRAVADISEEMAARISGLTGYLCASPGEGFAYTGNGEAAVEAVPAALLAFLLSPYEPGTTILTAVSAGGDAGSVGAMAGTVSGSFNGAGSIPGNWRSDVEGSAYLEGLAYRLFTLTPAYVTKPRPFM